MTRGPFGGRRLAGGRRLRGTASLGLALALTLPLTGCGSGSGTGETARVPEGWSTLHTDSLSVGYPKDQGYAEQPADERSRNNAAVALKVEDGIRTGMVSVQLDFATGVSDAAGAAAAAGAGIGLGTTRRSTEDIRLAGPSPAREARRIDYDFTADGKENTPNRGTPMTGVLVAGVDSAGVPFVVRLNAVKGAVGEGELDAFVGSITVK